MDERQKNCFIFHFGVTTGMDDRKEYFPGKKRKSLSDLQPDEELSPFNSREKEVSGTGEKIKFK